MGHDGDRALAAFLDDLEQSAAGTWAANREAEVAERARAEYSRVTLAARLMAGVGGAVDLVVDGLGQLGGTLERVAEGWCLVDDGRFEWVVRLPAVQVVRAPSPRAVAPEAWPVTARLGLGSVLRGLAGQRCLVRLRDGSAVEGRVGRAGADFVEVQPANGPGVLIGWTAIAAVRH